MPTRRRLIAGAALVAPALAAPWVARPRAARAATPRDVVVAGRRIDDLVSLDPHEAFEFSSGEVVTSLYQKLVRPGLHVPAEIEGDLAERWEIAPDAKRVTFHLRGDVRFASGNPVTAEDAAFSLQRIVRLDKAPASILGQFGYTRDDVAEQIRATGPRTLEVAIPGGQAPSFLLNCLTANVACIVERAAVMAHDSGGDLGNAWLRQNGAGSGPWVLRVWRPGEAVTMDANPHGPAPPRTRRLILRHVPDPSAQLLQLRAGDLDVARSLGADQLRGLAGQPGYELPARSRLRLLYLGLNQRHPVLSRPPVWQAVKWAIDYAGIQANVAPATLLVWQSFLPRGMPGALDERPFRQDVARARALLAEAGVPDGFEVSLDHVAGAPYSDIAQAVQANLAAIGVRARLIAGDERQVLGKMRARQHEAVMARWGSDYVDPHANAYTFAMNADNSDTARSRTLAWRLAWEIPEMTARTAAAAREADPARRLAAYAVLQREHQQASPFAVMFQEVEIAAVRPGVHGFHLGAASERTSYAEVMKG